MKTLIVYFSKSGRTRGAAEEIASLLEGADLFEIKVDKTYPPSYFKTLFEGRREFKSGERPHLAVTPPDPTPYDRILLGWPVWFGTCPMAVISFLEACDLSGKEVYPFCTSSMTGPERGVRDIAAACRGHVHKGLRVRRADAERIAAWLDAPAEAN